MSLEEIEFCDPGRRVPGLGALPPLPYVKPSVLVSRRVSRWIEERRLREAAEARRSRSAAQVPAITPEPEPVPCSDVWEFAVMLLTGGNADTPA